MRLAIIRLSEFSFIAAGTVVVPTAALMSKPYISLLAGSATAALYSVFLQRIRSAHFSWASNLLAILGLPFFSYLLWRSQLCHEKGSVAWKGRLYATVDSDGPVDARPIITEMR